MLKAGNLTLNPAAVYRLGTLLVWLGVLVWARLRRLARLAMDSQPEKKSLYRLVGHGMIFFGVLIWVP